MIAYRHLDEGRDVEQLFLRLPQPGSRSRSINRLITRTRPGLLQRPGPTANRPRENHIRSRRRPPSVDGQDTVHRNGSFSSLWRELRRWRAMFRRPNPHEMLVSLQRRGSALICEKADGMRRSLRFLMPDDILNAGDSGRNRPVRAMIARLVWRTGYQRKHHPCGRTATSRPPALSANRSGGFRYAARRA
jgi:hypothetical protein